MMQNLAFAIDKIRANKKKYLGKNQRTYREQKKQERTENIKRKNLVSIIYRYPGLSHHNEEYDMENTRTTQCTKQVVKRVHHKNNSKSTNIRRISWKQRNKTNR